MNNKKKSTDRRQNCHGDLLPKLGRPCKATPKTNAERQREFRKRVKEKHNRLLEQNRSLDFNTSTDEVDPLLLPEGLPNDEQSVFAGSSNFDNPSTFNNVNDNELAIIIKSPSDERVPSIIYPSTADSHTEISLLNSSYQSDIDARELFKKFIDNPFGYACSVCDRLWFKNGLTHIPDECIEISTQVQSGVVTYTIVCLTCKKTSSKQNTSLIPTSKGSKYTSEPNNLSLSNILSERYLLPRLPCIQIERLHYAHDQYKIFGRIINTPVNVSSMISSLRRDEDDYCINVHIKRKKILKYSCSTGLVNKRPAKTRLQCLIQKLLYQKYNIKINDTFFNDYLLWLNNAPNGPLNIGSRKALRLVKDLISVFASEVTGNIKFEIQKSLTCYNKDKLRQQ